MPRRARDIANSGMYHVVQRGNGRALVFEDESDMKMLLSLLKRKRCEYGMLVCGWCLMDNHVHLLLCDQASCLSSFLHAVFTAYAVYFNARWGHCGSVFQSRFRSVAINSDGQLLAALRYIHMNPEKAGLCRADSYPWSSHAAYLDGSDLLDAGPVFELLNGAEGYRSWFYGERGQAYCFREGRKIPVEDELDMARGVLDGVHPAEIKGWHRVERNEALQKLRDSGFTVRQVERMTGVARSVISRSTKRRRVVAP